MTCGNELFGSLVEKGAVIFREGDPGDAMYIIQSGSVAVSQYHQGKDTTIALLEKNDFFGEMALIDNQPRSCSVTAVARSRLLPLTKASLLQRLGHDSRFLLYLLGAVARRVESSNRFAAVRALDQATLSVDGDRTARKPLENPGLTRPSHAESLRRTDSWLAGQGYDNHLAVFEAGDTICAQGEAGQSMYIIQQGEVEVLREEPTGRYRLAVLGPQEIFGEMALLNEPSRTASVIATKPTRVFCLDKEEVLKGIETQPRLGLFILQTLILRLRQSSGRIPDSEVCANSLATGLHQLRPAKRAKLSLAFVSLSTCGGCTASLLDAPEELSSLLERADIDYCPMLTDREHIPHVDIAFVDGAVRVQEDEAVLKEARLKSHFLVSLGTCASYGGLPALANEHELEQLVLTSYTTALDPISYYLRATPESMSLHGFEEDLASPALLRRVRTVSEVVRVDGLIPGCPPGIALLNLAIQKIQGHEETARIPTTVCAECGRRPNKTPAGHFEICPGQVDDQACFVSQGFLCLGFVTRGGCRAQCPGGGLACWGCRGPSDAVFKKLVQGQSLEDLFVTTTMKRAGVSAEAIRPIMSILRKRSNTLLSFYHHVAGDREKVL